jgi:hypothetical protein
VGDRNKITIKDMIKICAKHAHVKNCKKRKYELVARNSVRNENNNLNEFKNGQPTQNGLDMRQDW